MTDEPRRRHPYERSLERRDVRRGAGQLGHDHRAPIGETGTVTWYLGDLVDQSNETVEIVVQVLVRGKTSVTNTASVTGSVADPNTANNSASIEVSVGSGGSGGGGGGGGGGRSGAPGPKKG